MILFFSTKYIYTMHQNIAGLLSKSNALTVCLNELLERDIQVDILCITEHFMMEGYETLLNIPNYCLAAKFCRKESKRGGACILVKNGHQWKEVPNVSKMSTTGVFECCAIELVNYKSVFVCVYRAPNNKNFNECLNKLETLLQELIKKNYKNIVVAGDFNIDTLKKNKLSLEFESLLLNFNLKLALKQPTRIKSQTCIDNFAHNFGKPCKTEVIEFALSDHTTQLLKCPIKTVCPFRRWRKKTREYAEANIKKFKSCLSSISFSEVYQSSDPNAAYDTFLDIFLLFYEQCFPNKYISVSINKKARWISKGIKTCSRKKRQLLWQYRIKPNQQNKTQLSNYSKLFNKIMKLTQRAQNNYHVKTSKNKPKTIWQIINQGKINVPKNNFTKIKIDNKTITNTKEIADLFNNYFVDKIVPVPNAGNQITQHITNRKESMFMTPSISYDIFKIITSLKNSNSVGYDGIDTRILKSVAEEICAPLSYIINLSISAGTFPNALKISIVKPLFKKEDKERMEYYRPISLIPIISKIFEKHICRALTTYFEKNKLLCNEQKGFRETRTINMAVYDFLDVVMSNMDKNTPVCAIFCDMTQAFDYVQHDILVRKLEAYGIRGNVLELLQSYLHPRKQFTEIRKINLMAKQEVYLSEERKIAFGVPQGSVLAPLLFTIYINDLPRSVEQPMT